MFLILLIVTQAVAEWVEISQQHYRKPIHTYSIHNPFTTSDRMEVEKTTQSWTHNKSVSEYGWKKGSKMQPNFENLNRVQLKGATKAVEAVNIQEHKYPDYNGDEFHLMTNYGVTRSTVEFSNSVKQKGIVEKVTNIGSVERVSLNNTPIKSPVVNIKGDRETVTKNPYEELDINNEKRLHDPNKVLDTKSYKRRIYVNNLRNQINTEQTNAFPEDGEEIFTTEGQMLRRHPRPELTDDINLRKRLTPGITEKKQIFNTSASNVDESTKIQHNKELHKQSMKESHEIYKSESSNKINESPSNKVPDTKHIKNHIKVINYDQNILKKGDQDGNFGVENEINENIEQKRNRHTNQGAQQVKETESQNKIGNMENMLKIMKVVADTISQNTRRSFGGKMRYLHDLKDTILDNIGKFLFIP